MRTEQSSYFPSSRTWEEMGNEGEKETRNIRVRRRLPTVLGETKNDDIQVGGKGVEIARRYWKYSVGGHRGKANQDRVLCGEDVFVVCDGHGPEGGVVSSFVSQKLLSKGLLN